MLITLTRMLFRCYSSLERFHFFFFFICRNYDIMLASLSRDPVEGIRFSHDPSVKWSSQS